MRNHESRPTGSTPFPEANAVASESTVAMVVDVDGAVVVAVGVAMDVVVVVEVVVPTKWANNNEHHQKESSGNNNHAENLCYHCGGKSHWSRTCRTPKHLVDLYQESLKNKNKNKNKGKEPKVETNFVGEKGDSDYSNMDVTHFDVTDFFANPDGRIDHLIGDGSFKK
ncbi:uncharacterized protein LOC114751095 [Neltuma alba]|uniref:uncharacterized protein LOC114751095 n=1 Tax=Neltuma alba TaxID=207710 RepID=UPI0010A4EECD|nr:uncharacterized protein LOC114751095 [Prosopis alba]